MILKGTRDIQTFPRSPKPRRMAAGLNTIPQVQKTAGSIWWQWELMKWLKPCLLSYKTHRDLLHSWKLLAPLWIRGKFPEPCQLWDLSSWLKENAYLVSKVFESSGELDKTKRVTKPRPISTQPKPHQIDLAPTLIVEQKTKRGKLCGNKHYLLQYLVFFVCYKNTKRQENVTQSRDRKQSIKAVAPMAWTL